MRRNIEPSTTHRPLLAPSEVAAWLNIPAGTLTQWRHRGIGPQGFRIGRHVRYEPAEVERWIREQTNKDSA